MTGLTLRGSKAGASVNGMAKALDMPAMTVWRRSGGRDEEKTDALEAKVTA